MKTKLALIGVVSLAFVACDNKEEVAQTAKAAPEKTKAFGSEPRSTSFKPVAPKSAVAPKPAIEPEIAQSPDSGSQEISPPAPAIQPAETQSQAASSATDKTTEQLRTERLARMAKAREERIAQASTQIAERFKQQDANGDGFLAKDEVSERMQRRFAEADKNGDGFLDATEQQAMIQATAERMGEGGGQRRGRQGGGIADRQGRRNRDR